MTNHPKNIKMGALLMVLSSICLAIMGWLAQISGTGLPLSLNVFLRFFIPVLLLLPFSIALGFKALFTDNFKINLYRALSSTLAQYSFFYYLTKASLLNAVLLYNTGPLFTPLLAYVFLKTPLTKKMLVSVSIGFIGVILILKPDKNLFTVLSLIGLSIGFFIACAQLTSHRAANLGKISHNLLQMFTFSSVFCLIPLLIVPWFQPHFFEFLHPANFTWILFWPLVLLSLFSIGNQLFRAEAYRYVNKAASLGPFFYVAIIVSGAIDWLFYHKTPDLLAVIGTIFIVISGIILFIKTKPVAPTPPLTLS